LTTALDDDYEKGILKTKHPTAVNDNYARPHRPR
jgi:hypothetical protein